MPSVPTHLIRRLCTRRSIRDRRLPIAPGQLRRALALSGNSVHSLTQVPGTLIYNSRTNRQQETGFAACPPMPAIFSSPGQTVGACKGFLHVIRHAAKTVAENIPDEKCSLTLGQPPGALLQAPPQGAQGHSSAWECCGHICPGRNPRISKSPASLCHHPLAGS